MDQRRLFLFLTICFLLMIVFGPKPKPHQQPAADDVAEIDAAGDNVAGDEAVADDKNPKTAEAPLGDAPVAEDPKVIDLDEEEFGLEYVTLGSVDPDSPYRLGVTFTTQGAGVRRVEFSSPRFRDLHDRSGYLGNLELVNDEQGGLLVQSLVAGTPAANAGLEIGDRIVAYTDEGQSKPLATTKELTDLLSRRKPGSQLTLQAVRGDQPPVDREITLARRPLEVIRPESENVLLRSGKLPVETKSPPSFQFTFEQLGKAKLPSSAEIENLTRKALELGVTAKIPEEIAGLELRDSNWEITERDKESVTFRKILANRQIEVLKRYRLKQVPATEQTNKNFPGYDLTLDVEIRNLGETALPLRYRLDGPNGLPIEGWWYANKVGREWTVGIRDVIARHVDQDTPSQIGAQTIAQDDAEVLQGPPLCYAGIDAQYFSVVLLPQKENLETLWIDELRSLSLSPKPKKRSIEGRYANVTCRLISHKIELEGGQTLKHSYKIFAGPKRPELLANYQANGMAQYSLSDLSYYGWYSLVSKWMLAILHVFYGIVGNYGIAIIMLTVLVRSCMFPISRKQAKSMAKMQELRPEMDKIKEKYKQDMQKQSQAMQELYRKHDINPLAGCLPLLIQMPIFLGLYRALMVDVELRQAPLLGDAVRWCSNLASPDMFYDWSWFMPSAVNNGETMLIGLGPYLNILPLATAGLFLLQQKMFMPEPANEQAAMQQKIMKYMMLVMGLLFFKVASGLCIYFIASSLWAIAERKMLPKSPTTEATATAARPTSPSTSPQSNGADKATRRRSSKKAKKKKR